MTAAIIHLDPCRRRPANRVPIYAVNPEPQVVPITLNCEGDPEDFLSFEIFCPNGAGVYKQTAQSKSFIGREVGLPGSPEFPEGIIATFKGHFWVQGVCFIRAMTTMRVFRVPLAQAVLMPESFGGRVA